MWRSMKVLGAVLACSLAAVSAPVRSSSRRRIRRQPSRVSIEDDQLVVTVDVSMEGSAMGTVTSWLAILAFGLIPIPVWNQHAGTPIPSDMSLYQSNPPTDAIPLMDGRTALVWWDARSDPEHPRWVCEVPPAARWDGGQRDRSAGRAR
jgi:hypothetical protein